MTDVNPLDFFFTSGIISSYYFFTQITLPTSMSTALSPILIRFERPCYGILIRLPIPVLTDEM